VEDRFLHLAWQGAIRTPVTRQLCHWWGAFQTCHKFFR